MLPPIRPSVPVKSPAAFRFGGRRPAGKSQPGAEVRYKDYVQYLTAAEFQSLVSDYRRHQGAPALQKACVEGAVRTITPAVAEKVGIMSRAHKLPEKEALSQVHLRLNDIVRRALTRVENDVDFNRYVHGSIRHVLVFERNLILGKPENFSARMVLNWVHKARRDLAIKGTETPTERELLVAALPYYVHDLNAGRRYRHRAGETTAYRPIELAILDAAKIDKLLGRLKNKVEAASIRKNVPFQEQLLGDDGKSSMTTLTEDSDHRPGLIRRKAFWSGFTADEQAYLVRHFPKKQQAEVFMLADSAEDGSPYELVAAYYGIKVNSAYYKISHALRAARRILANRPATPEPVQKSDSRQPLWVTHQLLSLRDIPFQVRLLSTLGVQMAWALKYDIPALNAKPVAQPAVLEHLGITHANLKCTRSLGYRDIRPYLDPKITVRDLPPVKPLTALSLLPVSEQNRLIGVLPGEYKEILLDMVKPANHRKVVIPELARKRGLNVRQQHAQVVRGIARIGPNRIEQALLTAYAKPLNRKPEDEAGV
jgi:hypothetical protein